MSIPPNQFRRDHPWTRLVLLDSSAGPVPSQAKVTHSLTLSLKKKIQRMISQWICNLKTDLPVDMQPKLTNLSTRPAKQSNMSSVEVAVLLHALDFFFF